MTLMLSMSIPQLCFAEEGNIDEGVIVSREEVAQSIAESEGVTYNEALQKITDSEEKLLAEKGLRRMPRTASISYRYYTAVKNIVTDQFRLEAWAYVQVWNEGSFRQFEDVISKGSEAIGVSANEWAPTVSAIVTTPIRLDLSCRGSLEATTTFQVTSSATWDLIAAEFNVSGTIGTAVHISNSVTFGQRWDLY